MKYLRRGSGYYIDVGASELVANGSVKLKNGAIERVTDSGLAMQDGSELKADLIVWATGYGSMNGWVAQLIDQATADKVGKCWGLGSGTSKDPGPWEGELRNMWKPTQVPNLWMQGGNLHQNRHYSLCLALQLKARMERHPDAGVRSRAGAPQELRAMQPEDEVPALTSADGPQRRMKNRERSVWRFVGIAAVVLIAVVAIATPLVLRLPQFGGELERRASRARACQPALPRRRVRQPVAAGVVHLGRRASAVRRPVLRRRGARAAECDPGGAGHCREPADRRRTPGCARSGSATRACTPRSTACAC